MPSNVNKTRSSFKTDQNNAVDTTQGPVNVNRTRSSFKTDQNIAVDATQGPVNVKTFRKKPVNVPHNRFNVNTVQSKTVYTTENRTNVNAIRLTISDACKENRPPALEWRGRAVRSRRGNAHQ